MWQFHEIFNIQKFRKIRGIDREGIYLLSSFNILMVFLILILLLVRHGLTMNHQGTIIFLIFFGKFMQESYTNNIGI